ncbi:FAD binding domain-containing protein [Chlamydoabsidia padenii]|nr:FAD binding domain-containing protein [Chlamydoabsidia padenii]
MPPHNDIPLPPSPTKQVDVLIVGAGPVGLLSATLLRQAGLVVRILDAEFEPNHWGRGDNMHGRTLELLERAGLEDELLTSGARVEKMNTYSNAKLVQSSPFVPDHVDSKYQYLLCVGQHITESSLQSQLSHLEVQVERPCTVANIQKNSAASYPLLATVTNLRDQVTEQVECKYIFGCDGAHSEIRHLLGIVYEGASTEITGGVMDALIRTNFPGRKDFCLLQGDKSKTVSFFPRENGLSRIFVHFSENENALRKEQHNRNNIQMEDIQREAKRALMPYRLEFLGTLYWSTYVVGQRQATTMDGMDERVFLLGDAAHCQSPTLGQGINTGFGDAFNLVWKLCLVERGLMDRKVLKTYTLERHGVAKQVLDIDKVAAKAAASHESNDYCQVVQQSRLFTSGFGIAYPSGDDDQNPLVWSSNNKQGMLGARAPNAKVIKASTGKKTRVFDGIDWLTFTILVLTNDITSPGTLDQVNKVYDWVTSCVRPRLGSVECMIVTTSSAEDCPAALVDHVVIDKLNQAQCHRDYGCDAMDTRPTLVFIRPDGHIGTICSGDDLVSLAQHYLDRICL